MDLCSTTGSDTTWPIVVNQIELNETAREEIQPTEMEEAQPLNELKLQSSPGQVLLARERNQDGLKTLSFEDCSRMLEI